MREKKPNISLDGDALVAETEIKLAPNDLLFVEMKSRSKLRILLLFILYI